LVEAENLEIVISAQDYASETLRGISGELRSLGRASVMIASNYAMLTREFGVSIPVLDRAMRGIQVAGQMLRMFGAISTIVTALKRADTVATHQQAAANLVAAGSKGPLIAANTAETVSWWALAKAKIASNVWLAPAALAVILGAIAAMGAAPKAHEGAYVARGGLAELKTGETVLKPGAAASTTVIYNIGDINISAGNINTQLDFKKAVQDAIKEMNRRNLLLT
jgi:hypothetical protein